MKNILKRNFWSATILILCSLLIISCLILDKQEIKEINNSQFGGSCPIKIYQIYDRDTGVYYAVTEKGGICVMETMSGETKLVDQGDGINIHLNKN